MHITLRLAHAIPYFSFPRRLITPLNAEARNVCDFNATQIQSASCYLSNWGGPKYDVNYDKLKEN